MQLYVSFSLLISSGQKNFYSAKGREGSGILIDSIHQLMLGPFLSVQSQ